MYVFILYCIDLYLVMTLSKMMHSLTTGCCGCMHVRTVTRTKFWYAAVSCVAPESPGSYEFSWANCHRMRNE